MEDLLQFFFVFFLLSIDSGHFFFCQTMLVYTFFFGANFIFARPCWWKKFVAQNIQIAKGAFINNGLGGGGTGEGAQIFVRVLGRGPKKLGY